LKRVAVSGDAVARSPGTALTYLPCLLDRMDQLTMAATSRARAFLDVLAEWALALPSR
jgi:hypothetical protein